MTIIPMLYKKFNNIGTIYSTVSKGPRYLELAEGYITELGLNEYNEIIGYRYINFGKMMDNIKAGMEPKEAIEKENPFHRQARKHGPIHADFSREHPPGPSFC